MNRITQEQIPVITLDGPGGSGKGTIGRKLAHHLQWNWLDSGLLYRAVALAARHHAVALDSEDALEVLAAHLDIQFRISDDGAQDFVIFEGEDVSDDIRTEECGNNASKVAALPKVREALLERQRAFREAPGLVTDGRDMGSVVFPSADFKFFIIASAEERANRRFNQLKLKGINVNLAQILDEIKERDERDRQRPISPLKPAPDAIVVDTTGLSIDQVFARVCEVIESTHT